MGAKFYLGFARQAPTNANKPGTKIMAQII
jgi:hypothetical protein